MPIFWAGIGLLLLATGGLVVDQTQQTVKSDAVTWAALAALLYAGHLVVKDLRR